MAVDDDAAAAGRVVGRAQVFGCEAGFLAGGIEGGGGVILAYTPEVEDGGGGEDVLGAASGVLGGAAGEEVRGAGEEVVVDGGVFGGVDEDGVVGLEVVFGEEVGAGRGALVLVVEEGASGGDEECYPSAWMSRRGFSRQRSL